jgi:hypothetical protein
MYANEASMTDATIHHGVVGIQGGGEIDQQKSEGINAVHEHLADVMKEAGRYGPELGAGAYKAGKYLMRLGDAGKNLGFGYIHGVQVLYDLGRKLSEDIKVRADAGGVDTAAESAKAVRDLTGRASLDDLLAMAMETAAEINQEYSQERLAHTGAGEADTETAFGHRTAPKKTANTNVLNQDMTHPADRGDDNPKKKGDLTKENAGDFAFRLTEAELAALKEKWAAKSG